MLENSKINEFARKYYLLYTDRNTLERDVEISFGAECLDLGFTMDSGESFIRTFSEDAFYHTERLSKISNQINDVMLLGSAILSHWRYITHWCNSGLMEEKTRSWFVVALKRLIELTEEDHRKVKRMKIGKFKEVDIRELWKHEQYDFSEWLSKDENIEYLNEILGLSLTDVNKEAYVGTYRCDLFAVDETSGVKVIIENQLESSNHDHLGKIITYASGLDAKVIVWIVKEARVEHRSAIEWLNNNTSKEINFFLIEIHAYKIGDSDPAPMFQVIEQPNEFIKDSKNNDESKTMNKTQSERVEFWNKFNEAVIKKGKPFNLRKASTKHWYDIAIGKSKAHISVTLQNKESYIGVEYWFQNNQGLFDYLFTKREEIEGKLGFSFEWMPLENKKSCRILHKINGLDFDDHSNYEELIEETIGKVVKMRSVIKDYI